MAVANSYTPGAARPLAILTPLTLLQEYRSWPPTTVQPNGEIWVAALWDIRANLIQQFGEQEGRNRVRQLVA